LSLASFTLPPAIPALFHARPPRTCRAAEALVRPAPALPPVAPAVVTHGATARKVVALTFDACEDLHPAGFDAAIIARLQREEVPATLFLGGRWMWSHPTATRALAAAIRPDRRPLFELGNHTYRHPHPTRVPESRWREELAVTQAIQYALTGRQGRWARAPYGEVDARVARVAGELGLRLAQFDVVTGDPDPHVSAAAIVRAVARRARPGSIVIMHVNGRGWHTAAALPRVITLLRRRGYQFVTMSELPMPPTGSVVPP
jgi:peptidoglycan/xylan/chitin deacetylase (PgdA/CDA1 family)